MKHRLNFSIVFLIFFLCSCEEAEPIPSEIAGLAPIYIDKNEIEIKTEAPRDFRNLGKIVNVGDLILINELYQGIHVIDNTNPDMPTKTAFWVIPGNIDFTVNEQFLYADNSWDLYTIDISDIQDIKLLSTIENVYQRPQSSQLFPADYSGIFECVDSSLGIVVGWEEQLLVDPKCWR